MEILLVRHGKPRTATSEPLNASEYAKWVRRYDLSDVADDSRPDYQVEALSDCYIVSSQLNRAIHSCEIFTGRKPDQISPLFKEMDIPRFKLFGKFKPMTWVYLCRVLWMLGKNGPFESYREAKLRAEQAASELVSLAQTHQKVVLFGHGFLNFHIRKALMKQHWNLQFKNSAYWGKSKLSL